MKRRPPTEGPTREWIQPCADCGDTFVHVGVRQSKSRRCQACRVVRKRSYGRSYARDHRAHYYERAREWRRENPEAARAVDRRQRELYREQRLASKRAWDDRNRDRIRENDAKWRAEHPYERWAQSHRRWAAVRSVEREDYGGLAAIYDRDGGRCAWCGRVVVTGTLRSEPLQATLDHVAPLSAGGPDVEWNVVLACRSCNCSKRDRHFDEVLSA